MGGREGHGEAVSEYTPFDHQLWELTQARLNISRERVSHWCESPIELNFLLAAIMSFRLFRDSPLLILKQGESSDCTERHYYIRPQARIGKFRVDFVIGISTCLNEAIVECDGREFHHSKREQIERDRERDRELEAADYKVFRFPGTEIYNVPFDCASEVICWLEECEAKAQ